ncbi:hypothetical protein [Micromonospora thermarum]|uniref:Low temperature requirement A protein (LtrA) n=1 Tax=Micromonospora thermarum TaxID=2720024 RepID=A0ABX0ZAQ3_9ACTN|nr:hypothetical protein [Micromonospora thermarum]NJP34297.1 hypothetical protein [Micromonospora thermarum]
MVSFATTVPMWRIYLRRAGAVFPAAIEAIPDPARLGRAAIYTHLVMVTGILATGVSHALMIAAGAQAVVLAGVAVWGATHERRHPGEAASPPSR